MLQPLHLHTESRQSQCTALSTKLETLSNSGMGQLEIKTYEEKNAVTFNTFKSGQALNSALTDGSDCFCSLTPHAFGESLVFDTGFDKVMIHPGWAACCQP